MNNEFGIKENKKQSVIMFLILVSFFLLPHTARAFSPLNPGLSNSIISLGQQAAEVGLGEQAASNIDIRVYVLRIVRSLLGYIGLILVIMLLYGGVTYMTSNGAEEKIETAKKIIGRAAIGTAIILSSYAITIFISRQIVKAIFSQMITQAQGCGTTNGTATCCSEWNSYQTAQSTVQSLDVLARNAQGIGSFLTGQSAGRSDPETDQAYTRWHDCFTRETQRAGLPSNLFNF